MTRQQSQLQNTKHDHVLDRLSSYIDGQLGGDEQARVEAHLNTCQSCRDDLRTLRWTRDLLQEVAPVPVPRSFVIREADVSRPKRAAFGRRPLASLQWATALVAIMFIAVVTGDVWRNAQYPSGGAEQPTWSARKQTLPERVVGSPEAEIEATVPVEGERLAQQAQTPAPPLDEAMKLQGLPADNAPLAAEAPAAEGEEAMESQAAPVRPGEEPSPPPPAVPQPDEQPVDATPLAAQLPDERLADATPLAAQLPDERPADATPAAAQLPDELERPAARPSRMQARWRVAEIGLGVLLVGLVIAVIWVRRHTRTS